MTCYHERPSYSLSCKNFECSFLFPILSKLKMISLNLMFKVTSQVADELVAEFSDPGNSLTAHNQVRLARIMKLSRGKHISDLNQQAIRLLYCVIPTATK